MTSTIDYAASTPSAPFSAPLLTLSQLAASPLILSSTSTPTGTTDTAAVAAASAASAAVARFEADFYPDWFDHITYSFLAFFTTFIVVCYGMVWYKIRVADRKMEERERGCVESGSGRRGDEGDGRERYDDDSSADSDLERGRHEGPGWSSPSSSSSSLRSPSRSKASYSEESDLESTPRRSRARTTSSASDTDVYSPSSADSATTASTDDDDFLSPVRPSTARRPLPRRGGIAAREWDQVRAVRYSRRPGRSSEKTRAFG